MFTEIPKCSRICAATEQELKPGDHFYSVLFEDQNDIRRLDYSLAAWPGPPEHFIGYWKSRVPFQTEKKLKLAPNEILLNFYDQLATQTDKKDLCYVLVLLLIRRRIFRIEKEETLQSRRMMTVYCPKRDESYTIDVEIPPDERIEELQNTLAALLYSGN